MQTRGHDLPMLMCSTLGTSRGGTTEMVRWTVNDHLTIFTLLSTAATTMYQRAHKLQILSSDPTQLLDSMREQQESYAISINSLSLLDEEDPSIVVSSSVELGYEVGRFGHIPA